MRRTTHHASHRRLRPFTIVNCHAFSLIEIIITVGLLSVIMLGLLMMFNQTQSVFRGSLTQVDVLESGRAATSLIAREMEQMKPAYIPRWNFFMRLLPGTPLRQSLPGSGNLQRQNLLQDVFFLTQENQTWTGIGYFVRIEDVEDPDKLQFPVETINNEDHVLGGKLYRFEKQLPVSDARAAVTLLDHFFTQSRPGEPRATNVTRIMDGVVHFRVRAFDMNGNWVTNRPITAAGTTNFNFYGRWSTQVGDIFEYHYFSNAIPASVELEIGLVEDRVWNRYKSFPVANARYNYLTNQIGRVHIFRQMVTVRNVDPAAYQ